MQDYFTKSFKANIFIKIKNFFYYKSKKFKNQLIQEISYAKLREDNKLDNVSAKEYLLQNFNSENLDYIGF